MTVVLSESRCRTDEILGIGAWVPFVVLAIPFEGLVRASIRCCRSLDASRALQHWLDSDSQLAKLRDLAHELRGRDA